MSMRIAYSILALAGFFTSLLVHLTTFFGVDPAKHAPWVWALHLGIFMGLIPVLVIQGRKPKKDFWDDVFAATPRWAGYAVGVFFAYALINFALFLILSEGGVPAVRDGKYVLHDHGKVIREISEDEYETQKAYEMRGFSGHWMVFYLMPALCFFDRNREGNA